MRTAPTNLRLDDQARNDARVIAHHFNLPSITAAVQMALRELARQIDSLEDSQGRPVKDILPHQDGQGNG
ncbi:MAG: hypothetical protein WCP31_09595 [Chloroflexales bacterium]